jgi:hypothetical protein
MPAEYVVPTAALRFVTSLATKCSIIKTVILFAKVVLNQAVYTPNNLCDFNYLCEQKYNVGLIFKNKINLIMNK